MRKLSRKLRCYIAWMMTVIMLMNSVLPAYAAIEGVETQGTEQSIDGTTSGDPGISGQAGEGANSALTTGETGGGEGDKNTLPPEGTENPEGGDGSGDKNITGGEEGEGGDDGAVLPGDTDGSEDPDGDEDGKKNEGAGDGANSGTSEGDDGSGDGADGGVGSVSPDDADQGTPDDTGKVTPDDADKVSPDDADKASPDNADKVSPDNADKVSPDDAKVSPDNAKASPDNAKSNMGASHGAESPLTITVTGAEVGESGTIENIYIGEELKLNATVAEGYTVKKIKWVAAENAKYVYLQEVEEGKTDSTFVRFYANKAFTVRAVAEVAEQEEPIVGEISFATVQNPMAFTIEFSSSNAEVENGTYSIYSGQPFGVIVKTFKKPIEGEESSNVGDDGTVLGELYGMRGAYLNTEGADVVIADLNIPDRTNPYGYTEYSVTGYNVNGNGDPVTLTLQQILGSRGPEMENFASNELQVRIKPVPQLVMNPVVISYPLGETSKPIALRAQVLNAGTIEGNEIQISSNNDIIKLLPDDRNETIQNGKIVHISPSNAGTAEIVASYKVPGYGVITAKSQIIIAEADADVTQSNALGMGSVDLQNSLEGQVLSLRDGIMEKVYQDVRENMYENVGIEDSRLSDLDLSVQVQVLEKAQMFTENLKASVKKLPDIFDERDIPKSALNGTYDLVRIDQEILNAWLRARLDNVNFNDKYWEEDYLQVRTTTEIDKLGMYIGLTDENGTKISVADGEKITIPVIIPEGVSADAGYAAVTHNEGEKVYKIKKNENGVRYILLEAESGGDFILKFQRNADRPDDAWVDGEIRFVDEGRFEPRRYYADVNSTLDVTALISVMPVEDYKFRWVIVSKSDATGEKEDWGLTDSGQTDAPIWIEGDYSLPENDEEEARNFTLHMGNTPGEYRLSLKYVPKSGWGNEIESYNLRVTVADFKKEGYQEFVKIDTINDEPVNAETGAITHTMGNKDFFSVETSAMADYRRSTGFYWKITDVSNGQTWIYHSAHGWDLVANEKGDELDWDDYGSDEAWNALFESQPIEIRHLSGNQFIYNGNENGETWRFDMVGLKKGTYELEFGMSLKGVPDAKDYVKSQVIQLDVTSAAPEHTALWFENANAPLYMYQKEQAFFGLLARISQEDFEAFRKQDGFTLICEKDGATVTDAFELSFDEGSIGYHEEYRELRAKLLVTAKEGISSGTYRIYLQGAGLRSNDITIVIPGSQMPESVALVDKDGNTIANPSSLERGERLDLIARTVTNDDRHNGFVWRITPVGENLPWYEAEPVYLDEGHTWGPDEKIDGLDFRDGGYDYPLIFVDTEGNAYDYNDWNDEDGYEDGISANRFIGVVPYLAGTYQVELGLRMDYRLIPEKDTDRDQYGDPCIWSAPITITGTYDEASFTKRFWEVPRETKLALPITGLEANSDAYTVQAAFTDPEAYNAQDLLKKENGTWYFDPSEANDAEKLNWMHLRLQKEGVEETVTSLMDMNFYDPPELAADNVETIWMWDGDWRWLDGNWLIKNFDGERDRLIVSSNDTNIVQVERDPYEIWGVNLHAVEMGKTSITMTIQSPYREDIVVTIPVVVDGISAGYDGGLGIVELNGQNVDENTESEIFHTMGKTDFFRVKTFANNDLDPWGRSFWKVTSVPEAAEEAETWYFHVQKGWGPASNVRGYDFEGDESKIPVHIEQIDSCGFDTEQGHQEEIDFYFHVGEEGTYEVQYGAYNGNWGEDESESENYVIWSRPIQLTVDNRTAAYEDVRFKDAYRDLVLYPGETGRYELRSAVYSAEDLWSSVSWTCVKDGQTLEASAMPFTISYSNAQTGWWAEASGVDQDTYHVEFAAPQDIAPGRYELWFEGNVGENGSALRSNAVVIRIPYGEDRVENPRLSLQVKDETLGAEPYVVTRSNALAVTAKVQLDESRKNELFFWISRLDENGEETRYWKVSEWDIWSQDRFDEFKFGYGEGEWYAPFIFVRNEQNEENGTETIDIYSYQTGKYQVQMVAEMDGRIVLDGDPYNVGEGKYGVDGWHAFLPGNHIQVTGIDDGTENPVTITVDGVKVDETKPLENIYIGEELEVKAITSDDHEIEWIEWYVEEHGDYFYRWTDEENIDTALIRFYTNEAFTVNARVKLMGLEYPIEREFSVAEVQNYAKFTIEFSSSNAEVEADGTYSVYSGQPFGVLVKTTKESGELYGMRGANLNTKGENVVIADMNIPDRTNPNGYTEYSVTGYNVTGSNASVTLTLQQILDSWGPGMITYKSNQLKVQIKPVPQLVMNPVVISYPLSEDSRPIALRAQVLNAGTIDENKLQISSNDAIIELLKDDTNELIENGKIVHISPNNVGTAEIFASYDVPGYGVITATSQIVIAESAEDATQSNAMGMGSVELRKSLESQVLSLRDRIMEKVYQDVNEGVYGGIGRNDSRLSDLDLSVQVQVLEKAQMFTENLKASVKKLPDIFDERDIPKAALNGTYDLVRVDQEILDARLSARLDHVSFNDEYWAEDYLQVRTTTEIDKLEMYIGLTDQDGNEVSLNAGAKLTIPVIIPEGVAEGAGYAAVTYGEETAKTVYEIQEKGSVRYILLEAESSGDVVLEFWRNSDGSEPPMIITVNGREVRDNDIIENIYIGEELELKAITFDDHEIEGIECYVEEHGEYFYRWIDEENIDIALIRFYANEAFTVKAKVKLKGLEYPIEREFSVAEVQNPTSFKIEFTSSNAEVGADGTYSVYSGQPFSVLVKTTKKSGELYGMRGAYLNTNGENVVIADMNIPDRTNPNGYTEYSVTGYNVAETGVPVTLTLQQVLGSWGEKMNSIASNELDVQIKPAPQLVLNPVAVSYPLSEDSGSVELTAQVLYADGKENLDIEIISSDASIEISSDEAGAGANSKTVHISPNKAGTVKITASCDIPGYGVITAESTLVAANAATDGTKANVFGRGIIDLRKSLEGQVLPLKNEIMAEVYENVKDKEDTRLKDLDLSVQAQVLEASLEVKEKLNESVNQLSGVFDQVDIPKSAFANASDSTNHYVRLKQEILEAVLSARLDNVDFNDKYWVNDYLQVRTTTELQKLVMAISLKDKEGTELTLNDGTVFTIPVAVPEGIAEDAAYVAVTYGEDTEKKVYPIQNKGDVRYILLKTESGGDFALEFHEEDISKEYLSVKDSGFPLYMLRSETAEYVVESNIHPGDRDSFVWVVSTSDGRKIDVTPGNAAESDSPFIISRTGSREKGENKWTYTYQIKPKDDAQFGTYQLRIRKDGETEEETVKSKWFTIELTENVFQNILDVRKDGENELLKDLHLQKDESVTLLVDTTVDFDRFGGFMWRIKERDAENSDGWTLDAKNPEDESAPLRIVPQEDAYNMNPDQSKNTTVRAFTVTAEKDGIYTLEFRMRLWHLKERVQSNVVDVVIGDGPTDTLTYAKETFPLFLLPGETAWIDVDTEIEPSTYTGLEWVVKTENGDQSWNIPLGASDGEDWSEGESPLRIVQVSPSNVEAPSSAELVTRRFNVTVKHGVAPQAYKISLRTLPPEGQGSAFVAKTDWLQVKVKGEQDVLTVKLASDSDALTNLTLQEGQTVHVVVDSKVDFGRFHNFFWRVTENNVEGSNDAEDLKWNIDEGRPNGDKENCPITIVAASDGAYAMNRDLNNQPVLREFDITAHRSGTYSLSFRMRVWHSEERVRSNEVALTILPPVSGITLTPSNVELFAGESGELALMLPEALSDATVTYSTSNAEAVSVSGNSTGAVVSAGNVNDTETATIEVQVTKDGYEPFTAQSTVTVYPLPTLEITASDAAVTLLGEPVTVTVNLNDVSGKATLMDAAFSATPEDENGWVTITGKEITENGKTVTYELTGKQVGSIILHASLNVNGISKPIQAQLSYAVTPGFTTVTMSDAALSFYEGKTGTLEVIIPDQYAKLGYDVQWISSNADVVSISASDAKAEITGVAAGETTITAAVTSDSFTTEKVTSTVTVYPTPTLEISVSNASMTIYDESVTATVTLKDEGGAANLANLKFKAVSEADDGIVSVTETASSSNAVSYQLTGSKVGTVTLQAELAVEGLDLITATETIAVTKGTAVVTVSDAELHLYPERTKTIRVEIPEKYDATKYSVAWTSDNASVATVSSSNTQAVITGVAAGTAKITATVTSEEFDAQPVTSTVTVHEIPKFALLAENDGVFYLNENLTVTASASSGKMDYSKLIWTIEGNETGSGEVVIATTSNANQITVTGTAPGQVTILASYPLEYAEETVTAELDIFVSLKETMEFKDGFGLHLFQGETAWSELDASLVPEYFTGIEWVISGSDAQGETQTWSVQTDDPTGEGPIHIHAVGDANTPTASNARRFEFTVAENTAPGIYQIKAKKVGAPEGAMAESGWKEILVRAKDEYGQYESFVIKKLTASNAPLENLYLQKDETVRIVVDSHADFGRYDGFYWRVKGSETQKWDINAGNPDGMQEDSPLRIVAVNDESYFAGEAMNGPVYREFDITAKRTGTYKLTFRMKLWHMEEQAVSDAVNVKVDAKQLLLEDTNFPLHILRGETAIYEVKADPTLNSDFEWVVSSSNGTVVVPAGKTSVDDSPFTFTKVANRVNENPENEEVTDKRTLYTYEISAKSGIATGTYQVKIQNGNTPETGMVTSKWLTVVVRESAPATLVIRKDGSAEPLKNIQLSQGQSIDVVVDTTVDWNRYDGFLWRIKESGEGGQKWTLSPKNPEDSTAPFTITSSDGQYSMTGPSDTAVSRKFTITAAKDGIYDLTFRMRLWHMDERVDSVNTVRAVVAADDFFAAVTPKETSLYVGQKTNLTLTLAEALQEADVTWTSSNEKVATVIATESGAQVTAVGSGEVKITAKIPSENRTIEISSDVTVYAVPTLEITVSNASMTIYDESVTATVTLTDESGTADLADLEFKAVSGVNDGIVSVTELTSSGNAISYQLTGSKVGDVTLQANLKVEGLDLITATETITVTKGTAVITVSDAELDLYQDRTKTIQVEIPEKYDATKYSVAWTSDNASVAGVSDNGTQAEISGVAVGTAVITATVTSEEFEEVSVTCTVRVSEIPVLSIDAEQDGVTIENQPLVLTVSASNGVLEDSQVQWTVSGSNADTVAVESSTDLHQFTATGTKAGTYELIASHPLAGTDERITATYKISILPQGAIQSLTPESQDLFVGNRGALSLVLTDSLNGATVTWKSSDENIATVSGNNASAAVTAVGAGEATITAIVEKEYYGRLEISSTVTVYAVPTLEITASSSTVTMLGEDETVTVTLHDASGTITVDNLEFDATPSNGQVSVTEISAEGTTATYRIHGEKVGDVTLVASLTVDGLAPITAEETITVVPGVTTVSLSNLSPNIYVGRDGELELTVPEAYANLGYTVIWSSSDDNVAIISDSDAADGTVITASNAKAVVSGLAAGEATITATVISDEFTAEAVTTTVNVYKVPTLSLQREKELVVEDTPVSVTVSMSDAALEDAKISWAFAKKDGEKTETITYSASDAAHVFKLVGTEPGDYIVTATYPLEWVEGETVKAECEITILPFGEIISLTPYDMDRRFPGAEIPLTLTLTESLQGAEITWSSSKPEAVTVTPGEVSGSNAYATVKINEAISALETVTITATVNKAGYETMTAESTVEVCPNPSLSISMSSTTLANYGEEIVATVTLADPSGLADLDYLSFAPVSENSTGRIAKSEAKISGNDAIYTLTGKKAGTVELQASLNINGESITANTTVTVTPGATAVSLSNASLSLYTGKTGEIEVTVPEPFNTEEYTVTWSSTNTQVATVSGTENMATITGVGAGTTEITATVSSSQFTAEPITCTVTVTELPQMTLSADKGGLTYLGGDLKITATTTSGTIDYSKVLWSLVSTDSTGSVSILDQQPEEVGANWIHVRGIDTGTVTLKAQYELPGSEDTIEAEIEIQVTMKEKIRLIEPEAQNPEDVFPLHMLPNEKAWLVAETQLDPTIYHGLEWVVEKTDGSTWIIPMNGNAADACPILITPEESYHGVTPSSAAATERRFTVSAKADATAGDYTIYLRKSEGEAHGWAESKKLEVKIKAANAADVLVVKAANDSISLDPLYLEKGKTVDLLVESTVDWGRFNGFFWRVADAAGTKWTVDGDHKSGDNPGCPVEILPAQNAYKMDSSLDGVKTTRRFTVKALETGIVDLSFRMRLWHMEERATSNIVTAMFLPEGNVSALIPSPLELFAGESGNMALTLNEALQGATVTWTSSDDSVTIAADQSNGTRAVITASGTGVTETKTVTVQAQVSKENYDTQTVEGTVMVYPNPAIELTTNNTNVTVFDSNTDITATVTLTGASAKANANNVTLTAAGAGKVTISNAQVNGNTVTFKVKGESAGQVTLKAALAVDGREEALETAQAITVNKGTSTASISGTADITLFETQTKDLNLTLPEPYNSGDYTVTWSSTESSVAKATGKGTSATVRALAEGTTTIKAAIQSSQFTANEVTWNVTVEKVPKITLTTNKDKNELYLGEDIILTANYLEGPTALAELTTLSWTYSSENQGALEFDNNSATGKGKIVTATGISDGRITVTATLKVDGWDQDITATSTVTVKPPVITARLSSSNAYVDRGVQATVTANEGTGTIDWSKVYWTTGNTDTAFVKVTTNNAGVYTITGTISGTANLVANYSLPSGRAVSTEELHLSVNPVPKMIIDPISITYPAGSPAFNLNIMAMNATLTSENVTVSCSNTNVVEVGGSAPQFKVTPKNAGTAVITVTWTPAGYDQISATCAVTVTPAPVQGEEKVITSASGSVDAQVEKKLEKDVVNQVAAALKTEAVKEALAADTAEVSEENKAKLTNTIKEETSKQQKEIAQEMEDAAKKAAELHDKMEIEDAVSNSNAVVILTQEVTDVKTATTISEVNPEEGTVTVTSEVVSFTAEISAKDQNGNDAVMQGNKDVMRVPVPVPTRVSRVNDRVKSTHYKGRNTRGAEEIEIKYFPIIEESNGDRYFILETTSFSPFEFEFEKTPDPVVPTPPPSRPNYGGGNGGGGGGGGGSSSGNKYSGSGKPATTTDSVKGTVHATNGIVTGANNTRTTGYSSWHQQTDGSWKLMYANGTIAAGTMKSDSAGKPYEQPLWEKVNGSWYAFGADGRTVDGWVYDVDLAGWFYVDINIGMKTGWILVNGKWYYLNPLSDGTQGKMYANTRTPDGYYVDASGAWDGKASTK